MNMNDMPFFNGGGNNGGSANWNDIQNKPFGDVLVEKEYIFKTGDVTTLNGTHAYWISCDDFSNNSLVAGQPYSIYYTTQSLDDNSVAWKEYAPLNGEKFIAETDENGVVYLGSPSVNGSCPFYFSSETCAVNYMWVNQFTYAKGFKLVGAFIETAKLDEKYLPDTVATKKDVDVLKAKSISNAEINDDGELVLTYSDSSSSNLGVVVGSDGKDGTNGVNGKDGADGKDGINGTDGIDGEDGISVIKSEINTKGELVLTYSDNTVDNLGVVVGANGKDGINGKNGTNGTNGVNGKDGHTPVKGTDYFTEEEKQEIVNEVTDNVQLQQVQADWDEIDETSPAFIMNKPENLGGYAYYYINAYSSGSGLLRSTNEEFDDWSNAVENSEEFFNTYYARPIMLRVRTDSSDVSAPCIGYSVNSGKLYLNYMLNNAIQLVNTKLTMEGSTSTSTSTST